MWRQLDTWRLRVALRAVFSLSALKAVRASPFLQCLPPRLGAVMHARLARGFATHANRTNPYARALLLGELPGELAPPPQGAVELVCADAAGCLEQAAPASFDGFTLSNILDGVTTAVVCRPTPPGRQ